MNDSAIVEAVAIAGVTAIEIVNLLTVHIDGLLASSIVGAIVFLATKKHYQVRSGQ